MKNAEALRIVCTSCHAPAGSSCTTGSNRRTRPHGVRVRAYEALELTERQLGRPAFPTSPARCSCPDAPKVPATPPGKRAVPCPERGTSVRYCPRTCVCAGYGYVVVTDKAGLS